MRIALRCVLGLSLSLASAGLAGAQAFENTRVATLGIGMMIPTVAMSHLYDPGITGRAGIRFPISKGTSFGIESGIMLPNHKSGSQTLYQVPVRTLFYFPLAAEGSSTPYLALGPGVTFNSLGNDAGATGPKTRDPYFTWAVKLGWAFRPELLSNTVFDLGARYEEQSIGFSSDFQSVEIEAAVGKPF
jgi:hypothetical protein